MHYWRVYCFLCALRAFSFSGHKKNYTSVSILWERRAWNVAAAFGFAICEQNNAKNIPIVKKKNHQKKTQAKYEREGI